MKIKFEEELIFNWHTYKQWRLWRAWWYEINDKRYLVYQGFITDGASIFFRFINLILARTEAMRATTMHDHLCQELILHPDDTTNWGLAREPFYKALELDGVARWRIWCVRQSFWLVYQIKKVRRWYVRCF